MEWTDEAVVLARRRHGESAAVVSLLTRAHGRHAGLVHGGMGRRARPLYEPGNRLRARWRARLPEHLGSWSCELVESRAAALLDDPGRLAALASATALVERALPEREPHPALYEALDRLLARLAEGAPAWRSAYVRWEAALLGELGFGLDLARCAVTGAAETLRWVSPRTGRAVSEAGAEGYRERLLPLPSFLRDGTAEPAADDPAAVLAGLRLTGHFLERHAFAQAAGPAGLPEGRARLLARLQREAGANGG